MHTVLHIVNIVVLRIVTILYMMSPGLIYFIMGMGMGESVVHIHVPINYEESERKRLDLNSVSLLQDRGICPIG